MHKLSAIIPTVGRPSLFHAVESVLSQTHPVQEVIVVADTQEPISVPESSSVTVLRSGPRAGGNVARMAGVRHASTPLVGFLDDDDIWLPNKVEKQLAHAPDPSHEHWLSTSYVVDTDGEVRPHLALKNENIGTYIFLQRRMRHGVGKVHTSTLVTPRSLLMRNPLDESLRFHQDIDWLAGLAQNVPELCVHQITEPLVQCSASVDSVANNIEWRRSIEWAQEALAAEPRWLGDFILNVPLRFALMQEGRAAGKECIRLASKFGRPGLPALVTSRLRVAKWRKQDS